MFRFDISFGPPPPYRLEVLRHARSRCSAPSSLQFGSDCFLPCSGAQIAERSGWVDDLLDELEVDAAARARIWGGTAAGWLGLTRRTPQPSPTRPTPARRRDRRSREPPVAPAGRLLLSDRRHRHVRPPTIHATPPTSRLHVLAVVGNAIVGGMETLRRSGSSSGCRASGSRVTALCPFESPFTDRCARSAPTC